MTSEADAPSARPPWRLARHSAAAGDSPAVTAAVLDALPQPAAVLDRDGTLAVVNTAWLQAVDHLGLPGRDFEAGSDYLERRQRDARSGVAGASYAAREVAALGAVLAGELALATVEHRIHRRTYVLRMAAVEGGGALLTHSDVTELYAAEAALSHQALHDPLTGLPNRAWFLARLERALRAPREPADELALLSCDVDGFKQINESLGHGIGDRVLAALARRLTEHLPPNATLARFGDDEFTILHEGTASMQESVTLARKLAAAVAKPLAIGGIELVTTLSTGIAVATAEDDPDLLLRRADVALYRAKAAGPARTEVFDEAFAGEALERLSLASALRGAHDRGELRLHYQPVVDVLAETVTAVEALVRWQHPTRGLLPPGQFVPLAEETGAIVGLGRWVLAAAIAQVAQWHAAGHDISVSVNLSARQLLDPELTDNVSLLLRQHGVPAHRLVLEITESTLMTDVEAGAQALAALSALGVSTAIDDFGTGFSSLAYLRRLPVDAVKIDRSFVAGVGEEVGDRAIIAAVVDLGRTFGFRVVGEGVETPEQHAAVRAAGCDLAQGYLYGRPLPAEDISSTLARQRDRGRVLAG